MSIFHIRRSSSVSQHLRELRLTPTWQRTRQLKQKCYGFFPAFCLPPVALKSTYTLYLNRGRLSRISYAGASGFDATARPAVVSADSCAMNYSGDELLCSYRSRICSRCCRPIMMVISQQLLASSSPVRPINQFHKKCPFQKSACIGTYNPSHPLTRSVGHQGSSEPK